MRFLFGGKGGVGKTTLAAAFALRLSKRFCTLLISTDPAHSLSDIFDQEIGGTEKQICENLTALEIDPVRALQDYKSEVTDRIKQTCKGLDLDIERFIDTIEFSPGVQEAAVFDEFARNLTRGDYQKVVFDTAPTGSSLRLLMMSDLLSQWVSYLTDVRKGLAKLRGLISREKDPILAELLKMKSRFDRVREVLQSPKTHILFILNPDGLSLLETQRAVEILQKGGFKVEGFIINKIMEIDDNTWKVVINTQQEYLQKMEHNWGDKILVKIPFRKEEIRGVKALKEFGNFLTALEGMADEEVYRK